MGALDIRVSNQQLNQLGQFRMPELNTGATQVFQAQAREAEAAASAARTAGMAQVEGISRRGQIVSQTLGKLGQIALEIAGREDERIADEAVLEKMGWRDLKTNGDGTEEEPGWVHQTISDAKSWLQKIVGEDAENDAKIRGKLSASQRRLFDKKMMNSNLQWRNAMNGVAAKVTLGNQVAKADELRNALLTQAAQSFPDSDEFKRETCIDDYFDQVEKTLDARYVPEEQRGAARHKAALDLYSSAEKHLIDSLSLATALNDDAQAVSAYWTSAIEKAKTNGFAIGNERLKEALGPEGIDENYKNLLLLRMEDAHVRAVRRAEGLFEKNKKDVESKYNGLEKEFSQNTDSSTWVDMYRSWGSDASLQKYDPVRADDYTRKADRLARLEQLKRDGKLSTDPLYWKYQRDPKRLKEALNSSLAEITSMRLIGSDPREVQQKQEQFFFLLKEESAIGDLQEKDRLDLIQAANSELDEQTVDAVKDLWNAIGMPVEYVNQKTGWLTREANASGFTPPEQMNRDDFGRPFTWTEAIGMTKTLLGHLQTNPKVINDREAVRGFVQALKLSGLEGKANDDLNAYALDIMNQVETGILGGIFMANGDTERAELEKTVSRGEPQTLRIGTDLPGVSPIGSTMLNGAEDVPMNTPVRDAAYNQAVKTRELERGFEGKKEISEKAKRNDIEKAEERKFKSFVSDFD